MAVKYFKIGDWVKLVGGGYYDKCYQGVLQVVEPEPIWDTNNPVVKRNPEHGRGWLPADSDYFELIGANIEYDDCSGSLP